MMIDDHCVRIRCQEILHVLKTCRRIAQSLIDGPAKNLILCVANSKMQRKLAIRHAQAGVLNYFVYNFIRIYRTLRVTQHWPQA
jgi:hypothetical protein